MKKPGVAPYASGEYAVMQMIEDHPYDGCLMPLHGYRTLEEAEAAIRGPYSSSGVYVIAHIVGTPVRVSVAGDHPSQVVTCTPLDDEYEDHLEED